MGVGDGANLIRLTRPPTVDPTQIVEVGIEGGKPHPWSLGIGSSERVDKCEAGALGPQMQCAHDGALGIVPKTLEVNN